MLHIYYCIIVPASLPTARTGQFSTFSCFQDSNRARIAEKQYKREKMEIEYITAGREGTRKSRSSMTTQEKLEEAEVLCQGIEDELNEEGFSSSQVTDIANNARIEAVNNMQQDPLAGTLAQAIVDDSDESESDSDSDSDSD
jgi:type I site-specific restriction-modification system R (restriction) subunit